VVLAGWIERDDDGRSERDHAERLVALARFSTTFGWRPPLPEWLGLGLRWWRTDGVQQDVLMFSAGPVDTAFRRPERTRSLTDQCWTTGGFVPIDDDGPDTLVLASPDCADVPASIDDLRAVAGSDGAHLDRPLHYQLRRVTEQDVWRDIGRLTLVRALPDDTVLHLRPPIRGTGSYASLRRRVYAWSSGVER
jgi:hypothetical protein